MPDYPPHLFACDPGLTSGVAQLSYDGRVDVVGSAEVDATQVCRSLTSFVNRYGPTEAVVVYERFTITAQTAKNSQAPWSLELIGAAKWIVSSAWGLPFDHCLVLQKPSDAKGLITNELLAANGIWHRGGAGHARDALRHGVYTYAKLGLTYFWDAQRG